MLRRNIRPTGARHRRRTRSEETIHLRLGKGMGGRVALQWMDGAGELHYEVLSVAQSWPYLKKTSPR